MRYDGLEDLSAFLDGELLQGPGERLLDALEGDKELRATWTRYHLIGDALAQRLPARADSSFPDRVARAIAHEPITLGSVRRVVPRFKSVVGLAMAASLAGLAIAGILSTRIDTASEGLLPTSRIAQRAPGPSAVELSSLPIATIRWNGEPYGEAVRFNPYIVNHNQSNGGLRMPSVMPYARVVAYEADR
jgi:sigma-E factor negative regulatory protein RseA